MTDLLQLLAREERTAVERWVSARARSAYLGDNLALCKVLGHYNMIVPTGDLSVAPHLMLDGYWEMWITQAVARHVKPGMRCIDVGANVGYYTVLLADLVGANGHVQAWEPQERLARLLPSSLALNGMSERAEVVDKAAGREHCGATFHVPGQLWGSGRIVLGGEQSVDVAPLDSRNSGPVDFVKIDAEGYEHAVWDGMARLLAQNLGITVLMEFAPAICASPGVLLEKIEAEGFPLRYLDADGRVVSVAHAEALSGDWKMLWLQRQM